MIPKWTANEIEVAIAEHFDFRKNIIVPNVSYGMFRDHEADIVVLKPSGWAEEVEIKISASDIKADLKKRKGRGHARPEIIQKLWFAVPDFLADNPDLPEWAGVLSLFRGPRYYDGIRVTVARNPRLNPGARKMSTDERLQLSRLAMFRVWTLKRIGITRLNGSRYHEKFRDADTRWRNGAISSLTGFCPS